MYCEKCGIPVNDGHTLCAACSAEESYVPQDQPECISLNYEGNEAPKKSGNGNKIALIAGAVALVVLLIAVLWKPISGLFGKDKNHGSAQEQFAYVEGQNTASLASSLSSAYGNYLAGFYAENVGRELELRLNLNEEIMGLLSQLAEVDLRWLNDLAINLKASGDTSAMQMLLSLSLGQTEILGADIGMDYSENIMWMGIPTLSRTYLGIDASEAQMDAEMAGFYQELSQLLEVLPDEQVLNRILNRYLDVAVSSIKNVERSSVALKAGDISQKCTALKATLDAKSISDVLVAILQTAKDDQELISVVEQIAEAYSPGSGKMISGGWGLMLEGLIDEVSDENMLEIEQPLVWIDYVDQNDQIIGRKFMFGDSDDAVHYWTLHKGDSFAFEADLGLLLITGYGTDSKGKINAQYQVSEEGMDVFSIEIIDLDSILWDRGEFCGTVRIRLSNELMSEFMELGLPVDMALDVKLDTASPNSQVAVGLMMSGEELMSIAFRMKDIEPFDVQIPKNLVPADDDTVDAWVSGFTPEKLIDNLLKAGVPEEFFEGSDSLPQEAA